MTADDSIGPRKLWPTVEAARAMREDLTRARDERDRLRSENSDLRSENKRLRYVISYYKLDDASVGMTATQACTTEFTKPPTTTTGD